MVGTEVLGVIVGHRLGLDVASLDLMVQSQFLSLIVEVPKLTNLFTVNDARDLDGSSSEHLVDSGLEPRPLGRVGRVVPL